MNEPHTIHYETKRNMAMAYIWNGDKHLYRCRVGGYTFDYPDDKFSEFSEFVKHCKESVELEQIEEHDFQMHGAFEAIEPSYMRKVFTKAAEAMDRFNKAKKRVEEAQKAVDERQARLNELAGK